MTAVLDSSAVLAWLREEPGVTTVTADTAWAGLDIDIPVRIIR